MTGEMAEVDKTTASSTTGPTAASPTATNTAERFKMVVPGDWTILPLDPKTRDRRIARIVERRIGKEDRHAYLRRQYIVQLRKSAADAAGRGAFFAAIHNSSAKGVPLSASVMAAMVPQATDSGGNVLGDAESMAGELANDGEGRVLEHAVVDLQVGEAARVRRRAGTGIHAMDGREVVGETVQFYVPLPEAQRTLALVFSTPILSLGDDYAALFDVMALSARWVHTKAPEETAAQ